MTFSYFPNIPNPPNDPADDVSSMQTNSQSIGQLIAVDHVGFNVANGGFHKQITFQNGNVPTLPSSFGVLFTQTGSSSIPQLFYYSGNASQTQTQYQIAAQGSTMVLGGIVLKWGTIVAAFNGVTYNFVNAFPNNCFSVQVTANIASTLVPVGTNGFTTTGFTFRSTVITGVPISYMAIGN
jgi:hypothetical protein